MEFIELQFIMFLDFIFIINVVIIIKISKKEIYNKYDLRIDLL
jgi:hypothetical protein